MADVTDRNGVVCDESLLDALGYCNGDATLDCSGNWYSPSSEDVWTWTGPNGTKCGTYSFDALGYCCGDATQDCAGNWYSPSNEDRNTYTDPNGNNCNESPNSIDCAGYCCGDATTDQFGFCGGSDGGIGGCYCTCNVSGACNNADCGTWGGNTDLWDGCCAFPDLLGDCAGWSTNLDCAGNYYSPNQDSPNVYTDPNGHLCNSNSVDCAGYCCGNSSNDGLGYCNGDATLDCSNGYYSPSNEDGNTYTDPNGNNCNPNSLDCAGYCCGSSSIDPFGACYGSNGGGNGITFNGCFDPAACGNGEAHNYGGYACMYDNGCGCGNCCLTDCQGNILGYFYDQCSYNAYDRNYSYCDSSMLDAQGYCCGTCSDGNACGEDSSGCLYDNGCGCGVTCPPSGDGEDNNLIYRLVGLPWFVRPGNPDLASLIGLPPFIKL